MGQGGRRPRCHVSHVSGRTTLEGTSEARPPTQAAYAAPLILLAQNRQDDRDRVSLEADRARTAQTKEDTEYLARELAALRLAIGEVATRDYLRGELDRLRKDLNPRPRLTAESIRDDPRWVDG